MQVIEVSSPIETIMREALEKSLIKFKEQVCLYAKNGNLMPKYILDFVVYGEKCKIAIECDGLKYHKDNYSQKEHDAKRDIWVINNVYDDVLRFSSRKIKQNILGCINEIKKVIEANDNKGKSSYIRKATKVFEQNKSFSKGVNIDISVQTRNVKCNLKNVELYSFGTSNSRIIGKGGIGIILKYGNHKKEVFQGYYNTNTQRMRLIAIITGLKLLKYKCKVTIYTEDGYLIDAFKKGWINNKNFSSNNVSKIKNFDLWQKLSELNNIHDLEFKFIKFKMETNYRGAISLSRKAAFKTPLSEMLKDMEEKNE